MIASITELNLKNYWCFLKFIPHAMKSHAQALKAKGIVSLQVKSNGLLVQRTLTLWENAESMKEYVRSGSHLQAMKAFPTLANKSFTAVFEVQVPPTWDDALAQLKRSNREHG